MAQHGQEPAEVKTGLSWCQIRIQEDDTFRMVFVYGKGQSWWNILSIIF
jgi:hypothetical protein